MRLRALPLALATLAPAAAAPEGAASTAFTSGDIWLVSPAIPDGGGLQSAAVRIDPQTWSTTTFPLSPAPTAGRAAYDPWRDRLVFTTFGQMWMMDASGVIDAVPLPVSTGATAPAAGLNGRLYYAGSTVVGEISFLDAMNTPHPLLAQNGVDTAAVFNIDALWYDAATNSLFAADDSGVDTQITKLELNATGDQVEAVSTTTVDVSASGEIAVGFSAGPGGSVFLKVDDNSNDAGPRMLLIDPATLGVTVFATSEYFGVAGEIAGAYAPTLGLAVVLDSLSDHLRTFSPGASGEGTIVLSSGVSSFGSGERAQMVVIPTSPCPTDVSGDGVTDGADLGLLLGAWGTPAGDLNGDGTTDGADLGILLGAWGAC